MPDGDDVTTPPRRAVVPSPRPPHPSEALPPPGFHPGFHPAAQAGPYPDPWAVGGPPIEPARNTLAKGLMVGGALAVVATVALGAAVVYAENRTSPAEAAAPPAAGRKLTPFESVNAMLELQAAAVVRGDEKAWLAAVDPGRPKLRSRYRMMFQNLRALGVSHFAYQTSLRDRMGDGPKLGISADVAYCFADDVCTREKGVDSDGPPSVGQTLTLESIDGNWVITALTSRKGDKDEQKVPWESSALVTARGSRVTLVGTRSEQKYFERVLPIADRAATVNDRFAGLVGNPQKRYRIYLAGAKQWKTWYGGITDKWVVGYALPLRQAGTDVVLNMPELKSDPQLLSTTVQHELGHVVTVGNLHRRTYGQSDMWLKEGIAEYIGWYPQPASASWRRQSVSDAVHGSRPPTSIAVKALSADARSEDGDAFYGLGHFAADCLAKKYGQRALFTFVRMYLREDRDLDPASQQAFGKPFKTVDRSCVAWIRDRA
ncbi:M1 family metallopeptidase [Pseudosporangium ferrugineum]|uniref:Peptidase MA superfamily protein n=1 Tax=Pseudosporangium ferrugineum TaxID=439699 RepID=A0A2T0S7G2_9ACTN|nr:M1 family metallopeptidase [Pseudosporangium ferrugineum]PRY29352.1 hypothetical protein CLV70_10669 [Pseudosporangium ferrugineum]